ncbi:MAG: Cytochrome c-type biogenesis protein CcmE [Desulfovibrio sp.]
MTKNTRIYLLAFVLFLAGTGYLVYSGIQGGSTYHLDVAEALDMPEKDLQNVRLFGVVAPGYEKAADSLGVRFLLQDQNDPRKTMEIVYKGAVPDTFKEGIELYAEGSCMPGQKALAAKGLNTNCPSKYKKENR